MDGPPPRYVHWATGAFAVVVGLASVVVWFAVVPSMFDEIGLTGNLLEWAILLAVVAGIPAAVALISASLLLARTWSLGRLAGHMGIAGLAFIGVVIGFYIMLSTGGCGGTWVDEASWTDSDLYAALEAPITPPEGMPVDIPDVALDSIRVWPLSYDNGILHRRISAGYEGFVENATRRFLEVATTLEEEAIEERVEAMMDSRTNHNGYVEYTMEQPIDMDRFITWLGAKESPAPFVKREDVAAHFNGATKHIVLDGHTLTVTRWGHASMEYDWGRVPESAVLADIRDVLQDHGLPVPRTFQTSGLHADC